MKHRSSGMRRARPMPIIGAALALTIGTLGAAFASGSTADAQNGAGASQGSTAVGNIAVVELFQSQGCSSCPPAAANLNALASDPHVLALSYGVTYWDQLGWKDTFASPQYTARQWDYARNRGRGRVWTPQVYVDGQADIVGSDRAQLDRLIARTRIKGPNVSIANDTVRIGSGQAARPATVWMVRYDPRVLNVPIRAGENGGRTLPHRNTVRELVRLGNWSGEAASFRLPARHDAYRAAVIVQDGAGGPIIGAAKA